MGTSPFHLGSEYEYRVVIYQQHHDIVPHSQRVGLGTRRPTRLGTSNYPTKMSTSASVRIRSGKGAPVEETPYKVTKSATEKEIHGSFHLDIWILLTVENWILDFGRPIFALYVSDLFPLSKPSIGDYCHMFYNVITAFCLLQLLERSLRPVPKIIQQLLVIFFVMGASLHLVGDSVQHRLVHSGYQLHLSVKDNPIMQNLEPQSLMQSFELLDYYDEHLGHTMWYIPLFAAYLVYFFGCFGKELQSSLSINVWVLLGFSSVFEWYLVTEGQIFVIFILMLLGMIAILFWRIGQGMKMDTNGKFLLYRTIFTLFLVVLWVFYLWDDDTLRKKYPEFLYVPEPWAYASLYLFKH